MFYSYFLRTITCIAKSPSYPKTSTSHYAWKLLMVKPLPLMVKSYCKFWSSNPYFQWSNPIVSPSTNPFCSRRQPRIAKMQSLQGSAGRESRELWVDGKFPWRISWEKGHPISLVWMYGDLMQIWCWFSWLMLLLSGFMGNFHGNRSAFDHQKGISWG